VPEPKPSGAELTAAQMEELLLEKDERIDQLVRELADAKSALETTRLHLQERATHVETLEAQLDVAGKREPTHQMYQQVNQLRAKVTSRERDLGRMRDALKTLKEVRSDASRTLRLTRMAPTAHPAPLPALQDMTAMAQENAEKVANAKKAAADAERRAAARQLEDNLAERMEKLQARLGHAPHTGPSPHRSPHPNPL